MKSGEILLESCDGIGIVESEMMDKELSNCWFLGDICFNGWVWGFIIVKIIFFDVKDR